MALVESPAVMPKAFHTGQLLLRVCCLHFVLCDMVFRHGLTTSPKPVLNFCSPMILPHSACLQVLGQWAHAIIPGL